MAPDCVILFGKEPKKLPEKVRWNYTGTFLGPTQIFLVEFGGEQEAQEIKDEFLEILDREGIAYAYAEPGKVD